MKLSAAINPGPLPNAHPEETQVIRLGRRERSKRIIAAAQLFARTLIGEGNRTEELPTRVVQLTCQAAFRAAAGPGSRSLFDAEDGLARPANVEATVVIERLIEESTDKPRALGEIYEQISALTLQENSRGLLTLARSRSSARRRHSSFYTPIGLINALLERSLDPAISEWGGDLPGRTILDPACGSGFFLLEALRMMRRRMPHEPVRSLLDALKGIDIDPLAVELGRAALWLEVRSSGIEPEYLDRVIEVGDAMRNPCLSTLLERRWDLVIGNPPFRNAIERPRPHEIDFPERLGGTADLANEFLNLGAHLCRPGGRVAMVQPKALLGSRAAARFRANPPNGLVPNFIAIPSGADLFEGAAVYVCLIVLGPNERCETLGVDGQSEYQPIVGENWWANVNRRTTTNERIEPTGRRLLDHFDVHAGMTASEAYLLRPFVREKTGNGQKLTTTGLIGHAECFWGLRRCRYLKQNYRAPTVCERDELPAGIRARLDKSRRPKLLVGGLGRRIKCFFDQLGEHVGTVSTYSIHHPHDDLFALARLQAELLSEAAHELFHQKLGANALGGGSITMTKRFLRDFPIEVAGYSDS